MRSPRAKRCCHNLLYPWLSENLGLVEHRASQRAAARTPHAGMMPPPNAPGRPGGSRRFARHSEDASIPATATPTWPIGSSQAGVGITALPVTSNSAAPSDLSSLRICTEKGGRLTLQASAAQPKCSCSAAASKPRGPEGSCGRYCCGPSQCLSSEAQGQAAGATQRANS
jgi:hypothetical protein